MRLFHFAVFIATILAASILAGSAFAAGKIFPYNYVQEDLPNGLRLVTVPTDYRNIVALYIVVGTGSRNEVEPGKSGFAHLFEHLMFRGTAEYPPDRYQQELSNAGAASNAFTTDDFTAYHTTFSKEDLPRMLSMEADRFQHLAVDQAAFKTETRAVLGEFNKNSANPEEKLFETLRATAFHTHTYRHTTMGFLEDVEAMPNEYEYSLEFFARYYRPEYTTIIVVGDVEAKKVRSLVEERWGTWKRGSYKPQIPAEPPQDGPRTAHVDWPTPTLPFVAVAWRGPAFSDDSPDTAALDAAARFLFDQTSPLYQKLVIEEQKLDSFGGGPADNLDPELFGATARVKKLSDVPDITQQITAAVEAFAAKAVDAKKLEALKQHIRYEFALRMSNSEAIAGAVARYVALRRTPEAINRYFDIYAKLTPEDLQRVARKYLIEKNRIVVTLNTNEAGK
jgi:zinc protease